MYMRKLTLITLAAFATLLLSAGSASARIGWTLTECINKYGEEVKVTKNTNSGEIHYFSVTRGDLTLKVSVILRNDKVKSIIYRKVSEPFTYDEIDILQKLNQKEMLGCEGIEWTAELELPNGVKAWDLFRQGNGQLQSILSNVNINDQRFEIRTYDQIAVEMKAIQLDKLDQMQGM